MTQGVGSGAGNNFMFPNVTSLPGNREIGGTDKRQIKNGTEKAGEFDEILNDQVRKPLKFSSHATQRLTDRKITLGPELLEKVNSAIDMAAAKGVEDTLVLTKDAALIVNVPNRTVITALDRNNLSGNVFTNIDGAVIIS